MKWKVKIIFSFITIWTILILIRAFYIQVITADFVGNTSLLTKRENPERGIIYDRDGEILAGNEKRYRLYVDKKIFKGEIDEINKIAEITGKEEASISARLKGKGVWVTVAKNLTVQQKEELEKTEIKGLIFEEELRRFYPEASLSAHLLGFVGKNEDGEAVGYFGVEGYYDKSLRGLVGIMRSKRGGGGLPVLFGVQQIIEAEKGADIYLTIEKGLQQIVKQRLKEGIERYGAKLGCIIVANPSNLEVLALSCLPDFDPNEYYKYPPKFFVNYAIGNVYEPGSIFKPLIVAAALQEGVIKPGDKVDESGPVKVGGIEINTWDNKYEGMITITRVLERSSNVGMVRIGERLGKDNIWKYLKKYGFFEKTGIDLQGEVGSLIKPKKKWYPADYATVTFGQGIAVTPIQMVRAFASLVNGGYLYRPHVVYKISSAKGNNIFVKEEKKKILSEKTSKTIRLMLVQAVEKGLVKWKKPAGYSIGGKTGTAQIPIKGRYDPEKTLASFIGFFPMEDPKVLILVILKEPTASPWGSETAAPIFFKLVNDLIVYYNIVPE